MQCEVRSMSESNGHREVDAPQGKVKAVCREWLVREDGMLAYKLQNEEIEGHYEHNKERNQHLRGDIQQAKTIQRSEEEEAFLMQQAYEQMLLDQENSDAMIAKRIQDSMLQEEMEKQRQIEETDQRIAQELQRKEKLRLQKKREERELRQLEKVKAVQSSSSSSANGATASATHDAATSPLDEDFSDLCINPPSELSEEQKRRFREEQDAEFAKLLQEQELRRRNPNEEDKRVAVEAQDRELAKALQEQERARARRAKERARQKALLHQQQQQLHQQQEHENANEPTEGHYAISPIEDLEASPSSVMMKDNDCYGTVGSFVSPSYSGNNVAIALDPTYNHKKTSLESPSFQSALACSTLTHPQRSPTEALLPSPRGLSNEFFLQPDDDDDDTVAPPYMPIQGQRRPQTLEKTKKNKKHKEGCKTQ